MLIIITGFIKIALREKKNKHRDSGVCLKADKISQPKVRQGASMAP